jgi:hypothetical protein
MNKPTPKTYRTTNWSSYNRALINRGNISIWFDPNTQWYAQPQNKQGRNQTYSDTAIQCCLMIKSLFRLSLRMVIGFVQSLIKLCGLIGLHQITVRFVEDKNILILRLAIKKVVMGYIYIDSTGLKFLGEGGGNVRNMDLNIVANGVSFILASMLKPCKYVQYSLLQIM